MHRSVYIYILLAYLNLQYLPFLTSRLGVASGIVFTPKRVAPFALLTWEPPPEVGAAMNTGLQMPLLNAP